jgi:hypothetical protein
MFVELFHVRYLSVAACRSGVGRTCDGSTIFRAMGGYSKQQDHSRCASCRRAHRVGGRERRDDPGDARRWRHLGAAEQLARISTACILPTCTPAGRSGTAGRSWRRVTAAPPGNRRRAGPTRVSRYGTARGTNLVHLAATLHARSQSPYGTAHKEMIKLTHFFSN